MKSGMLTSMVVPLLGLLLAAAPMPTVDKGVEPLEVCRMAAIGFSTATDGWASDHCGRILRSTDGGRSWAVAPELSRQWMGPRSEFSSKYIQAWLWLDSAHGYAFTYGTQQIFRTKDGGRTWTAAPMVGTPSEKIYALEHAGNRIWYCGSSGFITVSKDGGRTWARQAQLFQVAAPNPTDWCSGLSFLDERNGWASGWRSLYATTDGGETWTPMKPIPVPATVEGKPEVRGLVRLTSEIAWARTGYDTLFVTRDGGQSWEQRRIAASSPSVVQRADGRVVLTRAPVSRLEDAVPIADDRWTARATEGTANDDLEIYQQGKLVRAGPAVSAPKGDRAELRGTQQGAGALWGWHMSLVFRSDDDGRSWYRLGGAAEPLDGLQVLTRERLLGRAAQMLYLSEDGGRTWRKTTAATDRQDWERLSGESLAVHPWERVDCVLSGSADLNVEFSVEGCFGGSTKYLRITVDGRQAHVTRTVRDWVPMVQQFVLRNVERDVSPREARSLMRTIVDAATRREETSNCHSTNRTLVTLRWKCGLAPKGQASFDTYVCNEDLMPRVGAMARRPATTGYARATGIYQAADAILTK